MAHERVDRYELLELLGQGSFGTVHRARHVHTGQIVALKVARGAVDPDAAARILAEGRAAARLRHPNVVGVLDGGVAAGGSTFVAMELLEGETLAEVLAREPVLTPARAVGIALQILDALAAAHEVGVVHRDVKPSNVFVSRGDAVKVIDFGISKMSKLRAGDVPVLDETGAPPPAFTLPGVALGTPGYMAPEQLGDARSVDARADVYAVGATLFEMLAGKKPVAVASFEVWMKRLREEPAPSLAVTAPAVPRALAAVVDRALARDPDARWPSAGAMRDALRAASDGASSNNARAPRASDAGRAASASNAPAARGASVVPLPARSTSPSPARGAWAFAVAGVLLALIALIALIAILRQRARPSHETSEAGRQSFRAEPAQVDPPSPHRR